MINEILSSWEVPGGKSQEQSWAELQAKISQTTKVVPLWRRISVGVAVAASLAIAAWFFMPKSDVTMFATIDCMNEAYELPDGSKITLNANSQISFDMATWDAERVLKLKGHAFLEVEKGSSFVINTHNGQVEVLGTSFDVFARGDYFEVACFTGKVEVSHDGSVQTLLPGKYTKLAENGLIDPKPMRGTEPGWMQGKFAFTDASVGRVIEELEARFGYEITAEGLMDRRFSGEFSASNIQEAMELICLPLGLEFSIMADMTVKMKETAK